MVIMKSDYCSPADCVLESDYKVPIITPKLTPTSAPKLTPTPPSAPKLTPTPPSAPKPKPAPTPTPKTGRKVRMIDTIFGKDAISRAMAEIAERKDHPQA